MGAWGAGPLDNDGALDFIAEVEESDDPRRVLLDALNKTHGSADLADADEAIAGAFLVAVGAGLSTSGYGDEAKPVVAKHQPFPRDSELLRAVEQTLTRLRSEPNYFLTEWTKAGQAEEVLGHIDSIRVALGLR